MKAILKGKYEYDTDVAATSATSTLAIPAGDLKLRASMSDATFMKGPSFNGLSLSLEKPGFFIVDYIVPKQDFRFQFMNSVKVLEKPLKMTYIHSKADNRTILDGTLVLDSNNKLSANHMLGSRNAKFKYTYVHGDGNGDGGATTFEPCYDLGKNSWDFALSRRVYGDDVVKASYQTSNRILAFDWSRNSKFNGCFKISAIFNLAEEGRMPKLMAESTWNLEM